MENNKKVIAFFVFTILIIYSISISHDYFYNKNLENSNIIKLDKSLFVDLENPKLDIKDRLIDKSEKKVHRYLGNLKIEDLEIGYIMIENPDCQYFKVILNEELLDEFGDEGGRSNLWNGTYFIEYDKKNLQENNEIVIEMYSDYMTGIGGDIFIIPENSYRLLERIVSYSIDFINASLVITFFASIVLILFISAWRKQLYNIKIYRYFLISIILIGLSSMDYKPEQYLLIDFFTFKKITALSFHGSVMFGTLGISNLLNAKYKFNFGMISLAVTGFIAFLASDMIEFRQSYSILNLFLIATIIQLIVTIIVYRNRAKTSALVMIIGFSLCGLSASKLIFLSNNFLSFGTLIDMPIMIIIYVSIVLFLFYLELSQMASDYEVVTADDDNNGMATINCMQGSFIIDKKYYVVGKYSPSCDHIFGRLILGESILSLLPEKDGENENFLKEVLDMIFDKKYSFKDGFIALLPEMISIGDRIYQVNYNLIDRTEILLKVILSDVTKGKELEEKLIEQKSNYEIIINSLKSRQEVGYFIEKIRVFILSLKDNGFSEEQKMELHTIKGKLGQLGFIDFEKRVHTVESALLKADFNEAKLIEILNEGFKNSIEFLDKYIGINYFDKGYTYFNLSRNDIVELENLYYGCEKNNKLTDEFHEKLKALRYVDFKTMFNRYSDYVESLSRELNKLNFPIIIQGEKISICPEKAEEFLIPMASLFRNIVDHGIESPEERVEYGKNPYGKIICDFKKNDGIIFIVISDDGRGIDFEKILKKAVESQVISLKESYLLSEKDRNNLIFKEKITSSDNVNLYSGRGIGLSALNEKIISFEGTIDVESKKGLGTSFIIRLPIKNLID